MHAENFVVDESCDGQAIKAVCEDLPQLDAMAALTLVVEAVDAIDGGALVIASKQEEVLWILDLICKQEAHSLQRLLSTIDIVTQEQVVCIRWEPTVLEEP